jgi:hypothetical protein
MSAMNRRDLMTVLGASAVGASLLSGRDAQAQHPHHHDQAHGECLKACTDCAAICNETFHYAFEHLKDGHKDHARLAELTMDCHDFCTLSAALIGRESDLMGHSCAACAEACKACADECAKHDDKQINECKVACLACEKTCRAMAAHMKEHKHHVD